MGPLILVFVAAAAALSGCVVVRDEEKKVEKFPEKEKKSVETFEEKDNFRDHRLSKEGSLEFAESIYRKLLDLGVPNSSIDRGYYFLGSPIRKGLYSKMDEEPVGAGDGRIHELEIYRTVHAFNENKLFEGNVKFKTIVDETKKRAEELSFIFRLDRRNEPAGWHNVHQRIQNLDPGHSKNGVLLFRLRSAPEVR